MLSNSEGKISFEVKKSFCFTPVLNNNLGSIEGTFYDFEQKEISDCFTMLENDSVKIFEFENLIPNEFYTLLIDGIGDARCVLDLNVLTEYSTISLSPEDPKIIRSSNSDLTYLCVGDEFCFSVDSVPNAVSYTHLTLPTKA